MMPKNGIREVVNANLVQKVLRFEFTFGVFIYHVQMFAPFDQSFFISRKETKYKMVFEIQNMILSNIEQLNKM